MKTHFDDSPIWSILVCKIPEFKLWDYNFVLFDSENIYIKEIKKPSFTFSIKLRAKFVWLHGPLWSHGLLGKNFFRLSQKERFLEQIEKNPSIFNYWWAGVSNYVYSTILVITKVYIFLLYFTSDLLLIMRSQPASIERTVTSTTAAFSHCWSYTEHSDLRIICVAYIW